MYIHIGGNITLPADKIIGILIAVVFITTLVALGITLVLIQDECYAESGVEESGVEEVTLETEEDDDIKDLILDYLPTLMVVIIGLIVTSLETFGAKSIGEKMLSLFTGKLSKIDYSDKVKELIDYNKALLDENEQLRKSINDLVDEIRKIKRG